MECYRTQSFRWPSPGQALCVADRSSTAIQHESKTESVATVTAKMTAGKANTSYALSAPRHILGYRPHRNKNLSLLFQRLRLAFLRQKNGTVLHLRRPMP